MTHRAENGHSSYRLHCQMTHEIAALERLCQVVRIRGFKILNMAVEALDDALEISMTVEGSRPIDTLKAQLEKLHTVAALELLSPQKSSRQAKSA